MAFEKQNLKKNLITDLVSKDVKVLKKIKKVEFDFDLLKPAL